MIALRRMAAYDGPSPFSPHPALVADMTGAPADAAAAAAAATTLQGHFPGWDLPGIVDGADLPHAVGRFIAAFAHAAMNAADAELPGAGAHQLGSSVVVWIDSFAPEHTFHYLQLAATQFDRAAAGQFDGAQADAQLARAGRQLAHAGASLILRSMRASAASLGIPVLKSQFAAKLWQYGWGARSVLFHETASMHDSAIGANLMIHKDRTKAMLVALGLPAPDGVLVATESELADAIEQVGLPCVIKPIDRGGGKGVAAAVPSLEAAHDAYRVARSFSKMPIMVESRVEGSDYRLLVVRGRLVAATRRAPSTVTGDGTSTVASLVAQENRLRRERPDLRRMLEQIPQDGAYQRELAAQGLAPDSVVEAGRAVRLRADAGRSAGGVCFDETDRCHPEVRQMAEMAAITLGMAAMGADYITTDITRSPQESGGRIIELNSHPGPAVQLAAGMDRVTLMRQIFGDVPGRIPVAVVVVAENASDNALACVPQGEGEGWVEAGARGVRAGIGSLRLDKPLSSLGDGARALLQNRTVSRLTMVVTPPQLYRSGVPVDRGDLLVLSAGSLDRLWEAVLRGQFAEVIELPSPEGLAEILARPKNCAGEEIRPGPATQ